LLAEDEAFFTSRVIKTVEYSQDKEILSMAEERYDIFQQSVREGFQKITASLERVENTLNQHDSRLSKLEGIAERVTKLEGIAENLVERVTKLEGIIERLVERVTKLEDVVENLLERFTRLEGTSERMSERTARFEGIIEQYDKRLSTIEAENRRLADKVDKLIDKIDSMYKWLIGLILPLYGVIILNFFFKR
jgi:phage shock protein A